MAKRVALCIGAQKAGTSWLAANLRRHPQVTVTPLKEMHFLNQITRPRSLVERWRSDRRIDIRWRKEVSRTILKMLLLNRISHQMTAIRLLLLNYKKSNIQRYADLLHKFSGEVACDVTPGYAILEPQIIQELYKAAPDTRIVFIMRDPIERQWSSMRMRIFREDSSRKLSSADATSYIKPNDLRNQYLLTIKNWISVFPASQILFCFYDELKEDPLKFFNNILDFIGVKQVSNLPLKDKVHVGVKATMPEDVELYLAGYYQKQTEELLSYFHDHPGAKYIVNWVDRIHSILTRAPDLS